MASVLTICEFESYTVKNLYNAEVSAGSLMPLESRRVATLLLTNPDESEWKKALVQDNLLQKKSPATALRQGKLIKKRLNTLDLVGLEMITHREQEVVIQLLLVSAVRHSRLLSDFISDIYIKHQRQMDIAIAQVDWDIFLTECIHRDSSVERWTASTQAKLFQVILRILTEAKYLASTRSMKITPQSLHPAVKRYLFSQGDTKLINLLERA